MMFSGIPESHVNIALEGTASCVYIFFLFTTEKGTGVKSVKQCDLETSHDRKAFPMVKEGLEFQIQTHWRSSAGEDAGQSSHDKWKSSKIQGKWKEISLEMDALGSALKEKKHTWNKSCKECAKRETELYKMIETSAKDEKQEDKERSIIKKTLQQLRKAEDEADEAHALLNDMQQNVDEAEATVRRRRHREIDEYMYSWDQEWGRPHFVMDKVWQMMQTNDTKTMNLDKDFEEPTSKAQQTGWDGPT